MGTGPWRLASATSAPSPSPTRTPRPGPLCSPPGRSATRQIDAFPRPQNSPIRSRQRSVAPLNEVHTLPPDQWRSRRNHGWLIQVQDPASPISPALHTKPQLVPSGRRKFRRDALGGRSPRECRRDRGAEGLSPCPGEAARDGLPAVASQPGGFVLTSEQHPLRGAAAGGGSGLSSIQARSSTTHKRPAQEGREPRPRRSEGLECRRASPGRGSPVLLGD